MGSLSFTGDNAERGVRQCGACFVAAISWAAKGRAFFSEKPYALHSSQAIR